MHRSDLAGRSPAVGSLATLLRPLAFSASDEELLRAWGQAQACWGLSVRMRHDASGQSRAAEVMGPDALVPHVTLRPAPGGGVRLVEDVRVRHCPTLEAALHLVETDT